jgi:hypothetical protein
MARSVALFVGWAAIGFVASWLILYGFTPFGPLIVLVAWVGYLLMPRIADRRVPEGYGALAGVGGFWLIIAS